MKTKSLFLIFTISLLSCKNTDQKKTSSKNKVAHFKSAIQPIKNLEIEPEVFLVKADEPTSIILETGSKIEIPEDAFVDESGNKISGDVKLKWNEFHTLTDILLSGIPMKYDTAGVKRNLISGGMFTISAEQKDKQVFLAKGKKANIEIASINDTPCMNFYQLDEKTGKWDYQTTKRAEIRDTNTIEKEEKNDDYTIFDVTFNTNPYPELANKTIVGWKTKETISKSNKRKIIRNNNKCTLTKANDGINYNINLISDNDILTILVEPYFLEQALNNTSKIDKKIQSEYKKQLAYQDKMEKRQSIRTISISGFGTYNWDVCGQPNRSKIIADIEFENDIDIKYASIYLLTPEDKCIVKYSDNELKDFSYNPSKINCIIAILPNNMVYSCTPEEFNQVKKAKYKHTFQLINSGITLKVGNDLTECLNDLI